MRKNINFVEKGDNPPNVPLLSAIENFWGILASKVFDGGWTAKTERQLKLRVKKSIRELVWKVYRTRHDDLSQDKDEETADTSPKLLSRRLDLINIK